MRSIRCMMLTLVMVATMLSMSIVVAGTCDVTLERYDASLTIGDFEYELIAEGSEVEITGYLGTGGDVSIPSTIDGLPVTSIGDGAFLIEGSIVSISIPSDVRTIGQSAFYACDSLASVTFGENVTAIGEYAFYACTSLTGMGLPDGLSTVGAYAFEFCHSITEVGIPGNVTTIGDLAFAGCRALTRFDVDDSNGNFTDDDGILYDRTMTELVQFPGAMGGDFVVPECVMSLAAGAFRECQSLTSVTIHEGITAIGSCTFHWCTSLLSIDLPQSVTSIGDEAFHNCKSLTSIELPENLTSIGEGAFSCCISLESVTVGDGVASIRDNAFMACTSLASIVIGDGVRSIGYCSFNLCTSLTSILIPQSVTSIGTFAFYRSAALASITFEGDAPQDVGFMAFDDCAPELTISYYGDRDGFDTPTWEGVPTNVIDVSSCPKDPVATDGHARTMLSWDTPISNGGAMITGYVIYRGTASGPLVPIATVGNTLRYTDIDVEVGLTYRYAIAAINGNGEGSMSSEAVSTPSSAVAPGTPVDPMTTSDESRIILTWGAPTDDGGAAITGYNVYRGTSPGSMTLLTTTTDLTFTDDDVIGGETYWYSVSAVNPVGESPISEDVSASPIETGSTFWPWMLTIAAIAIVGLLLLIRMRS